MVTVLEHEFYLSEILDRRVFVKKDRIDELMKSIARMKADYARDVAAVGQ